MTRYTDLDALRRNISPDVRIVDDHQPPAYRLTQAKPVTAVTTEAGSPLAAQFEHLWRTWGGPELVQEYRFHPVRKWRLDYYHAPTKTAVELEGGLYSNGRHTRASGYQGDIDKYNAAAMLGITVLRLGTGQVDHQHVTEIIDYIKAKEPQP